MVHDSEVEKHLTYIKNKIRAAREYLRNGKVNMAQKNLDSLRVYIELRMPSEVALVNAYFQYYIVHNYSESLKEAQKYLNRKAPLLSGYAHYIIGRCHEQKDKPNKAVDNYTVAFEDNDFDCPRDILAAIGAIYKNQSAWEMSEKFYKQAFDHEGIIADSDLWTNLANLEFFRDNEKKAIILFEKALKENPKNGEAWYNLGNLYLETKNYDKSIECSNSALKSEFRMQGMAWWNIAKAFACLGNYQKAENAFKKALTFDLKGPIENLHWQRAYNLIKMNKPHQAFASILKSMTTYEKADDEKLFLLGCTALACEHYEESIKALLILIKRKSWEFKGEALCQLAYAYAGLRDFKKASDTFQKALEDESLFSFESVLAGLGWSLVELNKPSQAVQFLEEALARDDRKYAHQAWYYLGQAMEQSEQKDLALQCYKKAVSQKKRDFAGKEWEKLGSVFENTAANKMTLRCYKNALKAYEKEKKATSLKRIKSKLQSMEN